MKSRVACCPTVSLDWEDFFVCDFICNCCLDFSFYVCVLGQNGRARTPWWCVCYGDMIVRFWWPAMTSLMCFTFWCLLFVSVSCIAFLVGPMSFSWLPCSRLRVAERDYTHICLLVMSQQVIFFFGHIYDFIGLVAIWPYWEPRSCSWALYRFGWFSQSRWSPSVLSSIGLDAFSCFCCLVGYDTPQAVWARSQLSTVYASFGGFQRVAFVDLI